MKWFKHFSDNHRGQSVQHLLDEMGHAGPCGYYFLVEMCAEKLDRLDDSDLSNEDCKFRFHRRVVESALRLRSTAVTRLLNAGSTCNLFSYNIDGDYIEIKMPILLDLLEYDQKKSRQRRAKITTKKRLDKETDTEQDTYTDKYVKEQNNKFSENISDPMFYMTEVGNQYIEVLEKIDMVKSFKGDRLEILHKVFKSSKNLNDSINLCLNANAMKDFEPTSPEFKKYCFKAISNICEENGHKL